MLSSAVQYVVFTSPSSILERRFAGSSEPTRSKLPPDFCRNASGYALLTSRLADMKEALATLPRNLPTLAVTDDTLPRNLPTLAVTDDDFVTTWDMTYDEPKCEEMTLDESDVEAANMSTDEKQEQQEQQQQDQQERRRQQQQPASQQQQQQPRKKRKAASPASSDVPASQQADPQKAKKEQEDIVDLPISARQAMDDYDSGTLFRRQGKDGLWYVVKPSKPQWRQNTALSAKRS
jgi:vesicle coat complex subunit